KMLPDACFVVASQGFAQVLPRACSGKERLADMEAKSVVVSVQKPCRNVTCCPMFHLHRHRVEDIETLEDSLVLNLGLLTLRFEALELNLGKTANAEDLAAAHVLQQVAHQQIRCCLNISCRHAHYVGAVLYQSPSVRLNGKADHVEMSVTFGMRLAGCFVHELLAHGAVFRAKDDGHQFLREREHIPTLFSCFGDGIRQSRRLSWR